MNLKKAIGTPVAGHVPYGEPDYRYPRPISCLTGRQMTSHGKRRISASKQAQDDQKMNEMMENE